MEKTVKEMRKEIKEVVEGCPSYDICQGLHVKTIGNKYITTYDLYTHKTEKVEIEDFYNQYC